MLGTDARSVQADRVGVATRLAKDYSVVVVLKGAGSVIASPCGNWGIIDSGDPSLATAGSGDVLAGVIAALLAQGLSGVEAASLGAWLHGRAGELWAGEHSGSAGLSAAEIPDRVRLALNQIVAA